MKILILQPNLMVGGIEKSLINLLNVLKNQHEIDLFLLNRSGDFLNKIDTQKINIITCNNPKPQNKISKYLNIVLNTKQFLNKSKFLQNTHYDLAIVYHGMNLELLKICNNNVKAGKKVAFIHGDPRYLNKCILRYSIKSNDKVICVSDSCRKTLIQLFPSYESKIDFLYNLRDNDDIINKAQEYKVDFPSNIVNIISVARISKEKGHVRLLKIIPKLMKLTTTPFKFHFIGDGPVYERVKKMASKKSLQTVVEFYGNKPNPYPFFKSADLFILMSYNEAAPMIIGECACFKLPILSTNTISAKELIGQSGVICEKNQKSILENLKKIIDMIYLKNIKFNFKNDVLYADQIKRINKVLEL